MRSVHDRVTAIAAATARDRALIAARRGEPMEQGDQLAALLDLARTLSGASIPVKIVTKDDLIASKERAEGW